MTNVITGTCPSCGADNLGTKFCETCGAPATVPPVVGPRNLSGPARSVTTALLVAVLAAGVAPALMQDIWFGLGRFGTFPPSAILGNILYVVVFLLAIVMVLTGPRGAGRRVGGIALAVGYLVLALIASTQYYVGLLGFVELVPLFFCWTLARNYRPLANTAAPIGFVINVLLALAYDFVYFNRTLAWIGVLAPVVTVLATVAIARAFQRMPVRQRTPEVGYARVAPQLVQLADGNQVYMQPAQRTNALAITALVLGIIGGNVLPVVFGHVALSQIRRTGERGEGMAVAGLVLGYVWTALLVTLLIVVAVSRR